MLNIILLALALQNPAAGVFEPASEWKTQKGANILSATATSPDQKSRILLSCIPSSKELQLKVESKEKFGQAKAGTVTLFFSALVPTDRTAWYFADYEVGTSDRATVNLIAARLSGNDRTAVFLISPLAAPKSRLGFMTKGAAGAIGTVYRTCDVSLPVAN